MDLTTVTVNRGGRRFVVRDAGGPAPLYVYRPLLDPASLMSWARSVGLRDLHEPGELHVTVVYSKSPVEWFSLEGDPYGTEVVGGPRRLEQFKDVVVLRLSSRVLQGRWDYYRRRGCSSDFATYAPHVTLASSRWSVDLDEVEAYSGRLEFGPEVFAPIK